MLLPMFISASVSILVWGLFKWIIIFSGYISQYKIPFCYRKIRALVSFVMSDARIDIFDVIDL